MRLRSVDTFQNKHTSQSILNSLTIKFVLVKHLKCATYPPSFIMEDEDILSSSCSSTDERQELQELLSTSRSSLNLSVEIVECCTPPRENPPVEILNRLIEVTPGEVHAQEPNHASLNSTIDLMDEEDSSAQNSSDSVQDNVPSAHVENTPSFDYDIEGRYDYEVTGVDGKPYVPPDLIPAYFTSRIHYDSCGRCTRAKDFGYEDWLKLEISGDSEALEEIGDCFCLLCGLHCVSSGLRDKHVESVHELRGWIPRLEECPVCYNQSFFPRPPSI